MMTRRILFLALFGAMAAALWAAGEMQHKDIGQEMTKDEWEAIDTHYLDGGTRGDIIRQDSSGNLARLGVGSNGQRLGSDGTDPQWESPELVEGTRQLTPSLTGGTLDADLHGTAYSEWLLYPMDETSGSTLYDSSGRGDATLSGNTADNLTTSGQVGTALDLPAAGSGYITPDTAIDDLLTTGQDFSIAFWWRHELDGTGNLTNEHFAGNFPDSFDAFVAFFNLNNTDTYIRVRTPDMTGNLDHIITGANDVLWHHYALTRDDATFRWYRDGALLKTDTDAAENTGTLDSGSIFRIGRHAAYSSQGAPGVVDDFRTLDRALTIAEVKGLYNAGSGTASRIEHVAAADGYLSLDQLGLGDLVWEYDYSNERTDLSIGGDNAMTFRNRSGYSPEVGIGITAPMAPVHINTASTEGRVALRIDQDDSDQAFVRFSGTESTDPTMGNISTRSNINSDSDALNPIAGPAASDWASTKSLQVELGGNTYWIMLYQYTP